MPTPKRPYAVEFRHQMVDPFALPRMLDGFVPSHAAPAAPMKALASRSAE